MEKSLQDMLWVLLCTGLVLLMQAGFLCVESGLTRSKNSINVAMKNITDFGVATLCFWLLGFGFMFGKSWNQLIGLDGFGPALDVPWQGTFFAFQLVFCGTAATIVSGAVAERLSFSAYLLSSAMISLLVYPIVGHWVWGGALAPANSGWLQQLGFIDFAGSTVVHAVGGGVALAGVRVVGPRNGRYPPGQKPKAVTGSNLPLAMLGGIILWFGWLGFNGGSTLGLTANIPRIITNTLLAGAAGLLVSLLVGRVVLGFPEATAPLNGSLAGLVAITASCFAVESSEALLIGGVAGGFVLPTTALMDRLHLDDAVGAIPVHLVGGIWGTLCVSLFGDPDLLGTGLGFWDQLGVQASGAVAGAGFAFVAALVVLSGVNRIRPLRVNTEDEKMGLNIAEHRATTELIDLFVARDHQHRTGDLSADVPVEPFTEVGQIAERYNLGLQKIRGTLRENEEARDILSDAFRRVHEEQARAESLLLNVLPPAIAEQLKENPDVIAHSFSDVTVMFADIVGFTRFADRYRAESVVTMLNRVFSIFDELIDEYGLEKIKTIGDAYMVVGGLPAPMPHHAENVARFALAVMERISRLRVNRERIQLRIGINTGPAVAGVIGTKKFIYDIWGDSVNVASRLESQGVPGMIQVSESTAERLQSKFVVEERGLLDIKGKGQVRSFFLRGFLEPGLPAEPAPGF